MANPFLASVITLCAFTSLATAETTAGSVKDYLICYQAYVNVTGYLQFAELEGMKGEQVAFEVDFQRFIEMGIMQYGEKQVREMAPEPEESFIESVIPLHSVDGPTKTAGRLLQMVAPCGGPNGELQAYYPA